VEGESLSIGGGRKRRKKEKMKRVESSVGKAFLSKKRFALVEIAVVLFSVFLVALPGMGIAADQPTQEANATTITTIKTASEDDYCRRHIRQRKRRRHH